MSARESILRLFVAVYPPAETVSALRAALESPELDSRGCVPDDQVHMTLQFIGDSAERELADIQESLERAASGLPAFDLRAFRLITLPEGPRPRLVAAETDSPPPLLELHRRLAHRLARNTRDRSRERFRPHLTLQRFKAPRGAIDLPVHTAPFRVEQVALVRSVLKPAGAEHVVLSWVALNGD